MCRSDTDLIDLVAIRSLIDLVAIRIAFFKLQDLRLLWFLACLPHLMLLERSYSRRCCTCGTDNNSLPNMASVQMKAFFTACTISNQIELAENNPNTVQHMGL